MKVKGLTDKERVFAEQNSNIISEFLLSHHCDYEESYGDAAIGFIRAIKFCFRFSSFTKEQFADIAELFMEEALTEQLSPLEIINLDDVVEESYCMDENEITEQTVEIAAEQFMKMRLVEHLLMTAAPSEKKIMELIYAGVPNTQILYSQGISQEEYESILSNIRSRTCFAA